MRRSAIVTGGTGGLGSAVVARLLHDGWRVVVPWVAEQELQRVASRDGLELVQADLFDPDAAREVIAAAVAERAVPLGGLVNLVGGFAAGPRIHETPIDDFELQFRLNLRPTYPSTHSVFPQPGLRLHRASLATMRDAPGPSPPTLCGHGLKASVNFPPRAP